MGLPAQNLVLQAPPGSGLGVTDLSSSGLLTSPCALGRLLGSLGWALGGCMGPQLPVDGQQLRLGPAERLSLPQSGAMGLAATWGSQGHRLTAAALTPGAPARLEGLWQVCIIVDGSGPILPPPHFCFSQAPPYISHAHICPVMTAPQRTPCGRRHCPAHRQRAFISWLVF